MIVRQLDGGGDRNFSYLIADETTKDAAVIDPGSPPRAELAALDAEGLTLRYIVATHGHFDHTGGIRELARRTGAKIAVHPVAPIPHDIALADGGIIEVGGIPLRIIHTPGHTHDSLCILAGGNLFAGDTLFVGKIGGTGTVEEARAEFDSLHRKLMTLPPTTRVWPGHDYGVRQVSTIGDELRENPFILRPDFESFLELKQNWLEYKREHGIA